MRSKANLKTQEHALALSIILLAMQRVGEITLGHYQLRSKKLELHSGVPVSRVLLYVDGRRTASVFFPDAVDNPAHQQVHIFGGESYCWEWMPEDNTIHLVDETEVV